MAPRVLELIDKETGQVVTLFTIPEGKDPAMEVMLQFTRQWQEVATRQTLEILLDQAARRMLPPALPARVIEVDIKIEAA